MVGSTEARPLCHGAPKGHPTPSRSGLCIVYIYIYIIQVFTPLLQTPTSPQTGKLLLLIYRNTVSRPMIQTGFISVGDSGLPVLSGCLLDCHLHLTPPKHSAMSCMTCNLSHFACGGFLWDDPFNTLNFRRFLIVVWCFSSGSRPPASSRKAACFSEH